MSKTKNAQRPLSAPKLSTKFIVLGLAALLFVLTAVGVIALKVSNDNRYQVAEEGPVPVAGTIYGGIVSPATAAPAPAKSINWTKLPAKEPATDFQAATGAPAKVVLYVDPNCVHCADFDDRNATMLRAKVAAGHISVETRAVAFLDRASPTNYSSRAANAMACVANSHPEKYLSFVSSLFEAHGQGEMRNAALSQLAADNGAPGLESCIAEGTFRPFVKTTTETAASHGVTGTPAVFINGAPFALGEDLEQAIDVARK